MLEKGSVFSSFFPAEIRLFFQFVWNYRQQGILQNLALVHGTKKYYPVWCSVWSLPGLGVVGNSRIIFNLIYFLMIHEQAEMFLKLSHFTGVFPLVLQFVLLSGNTIQALSQNDPWKAEMWFNVLSVLLGTLKHAWKLPWEQHLFIAAL